MDTYLTAHPSRYGNHVAPYRVNKDSIKPRSVWSSCPNTTSLIVVVGNIFRFSDVISSIDLKIDFMQIKKKRDAASTTTPRLFWKQRDIVPSLRILQLTSSLTTHHPSHHWVTNLTASSHCLSRGTDCYCGFHVSFNSSQTDFIPLREQRKNSIQIDSTRNLQRRDPPKS